MSKTGSVCALLFGLVPACGGQNFPEKSGGYNVERRSYEYKTQAARVEAGWYPEWTAKFGETYPEPLPPAQKWLHPYMEHALSGAMHEDSHSSDVSNLPGPTLKSPRVHYMHSLEKGGRFTGMCPLFMFLDEKTLATIAFGRDGATLVLFDIGGPPKLLDSIDLPGRGAGMFDLIGKESRLAVFRDTHGGAYSYLSKDHYIYVPGANNTIIRIPIRHRKIFRPGMQVLRLLEQVEEGSIVDDALSSDQSINKLTALMPDAQGNIWFTSRLGVVGLIRPNEQTAQGFPKIYTSFIGYFAAREKVEQALHGAPEDVKAFFAEHEVITEESTENLKELRKQFRALFVKDPKTNEEIQNSFAVGKDGVYINSNFAMYKLRFNEETKRIELDPKWAPTYADGHLVYPNDFKRKPGHLNAGSGTSPTLVGDDFVVIVDNGPQVSLMVYRQQDGKLVSKLPLFEPGKGAVENSVVAYGKSLVVPNMYGYTDPFVVNETPGGIVRFDFNEATGKYEKVEGWPAAKDFDPKTATPKLSTATGLLYAYNRSDTPVNGHLDWQLTALDFRTGHRVFYIKGYLEDGEFEDNVIGLVKSQSLGRKNYDRKVFTNLMGTYSFGPNKSIYLGAYRGFMVFRSE